MQTMSSTLLALWLGREEDSAYLYLFLLFYLKFIGSHLVSLIRITRCRTLFAFWPLP